MLQNLMDAYWDKLDITREEKMQIHPSSLSSLCLREYFYILSGKWIRLNPPVEMKKLLSRAKTIHLEIQNIWEELGILIGTWVCLNCEAKVDGKRPVACPVCQKSKFIYSEVPLSCEKYLMIGSADAILEIDGKRGLGEIKTINTYKFFKLEKPETQHIEQIHCYFLMSGLDFAWVIYVNRDNGKYKIFEVARDEKIIDQIKVKAGLLKMCLEKDVPPPLNYDSNNLYCKRKCMTSSLCREHYQEVEDWMKEGETDDKPKRKRGRPRKNNG